MFVFCFVFFVAVVKNEQSSAVESGERRILDVMMLLS